MLCHAMVERSLLAHAATVGLGHRAVRVRVMCECECEAVSVGLDHRSVSVSVSASGSVSASVKPLQWVWIIAVIAKGERLGGRPKVPQT